ncbi:MAG: hypothetical protein UV67_C0006G0029 [Parcubacteria group bacterium GW2011_GWC1_43_12]|nr:MAG: hypothetical protein UV67_C0006G0029 [Parcubacteria group bacterium GW2011_GWC1_43_12]
MNPESNLGIPENVQAGQNLEKREEENEYNPLEILREREFYPGVIEVEEGKEIITDEDYKACFEFLRENIKDGSLLNLNFGSGITHCHYMLPLIDRLSHVTALDISAKNNQLIGELLNSIQDKGNPEIIEEEDKKMLRDLAQAVSKDEDFGIKESGEELLAMLHEKSQHEGKSDIITADMIEDMEKLGSGELVGDRKFDNIYLSFSIYARTREELVGFLKNAKERLNEGGNLLIIDCENYTNESGEEKELFSEDKVIEEKYGEVFDWTLDEMKEILNEVGFSSVNSQIREIEAKEDEAEEFGTYLFIKAQK